MQRKTPSPNYAGAQAPGRDFPGLIIREKDPENLEFPFPALQSETIPNEHFFIRNHFPAPHLEKKDWKLRVEGFVENPFELDYEEFRAMATREVSMTLECAGNSRIFLSPKVSGLQWELGAVGNARWAGVPLEAILERAGVKGGALEVVLEGADSGEITKDPKSPGKISFARSLPLEKAQGPEVILAHTMNGEPLPAAHGFPVRAIVPGWYAMASVKWLTRISVVERPFRGYFQTADYTFWETRGELPIELLPVGAMEVKAEIARPALRELVPADSVVRVHGAAWAGESEVARVEVSTDGGKKWQTANLKGEQALYAWRLWDYQWKTPREEGRHVIMARATDAAGKVQPMERDQRRGTYIISHVQPIEVEIRKAAEVDPDGQYHI